MAISGHQISVPVPVRCRSVPRFPGLTASGRWTRRPASCWSRPTAPARATPSRPAMTSATATRVTPTPRTSRPWTTAPARAAPRSFRPARPARAVPASARATRSSPAITYPATPPRPVTPPPTGHVPGGSTPGDGIWPVTGSQEALPDTGPQRPAYPEQWYDNPRLSDRAKLPADPRLEGMNYDELRSEDSSP